MIDGPSGLEKGLNVDFGKTSTELIRGIEYHRIPFPQDGRFVNSFVERHPEVSKTRDLWPDLIEANQERPEITMLFPGYKETHTKSIMRGRTVHSLIEKLDDTIAFVDWMNTTHIEELIVRGLADHFEQSNYKGIKLFGASHGGYFALKLLNYFHELRKEDFNIPIESLVVAVAPASRQCFKKGVPLDPGLIAGISHLALDKFIKKVSGQRLYVPVFLRRSRSDAVRIMSVSSVPFSKGDFPEGQVVHYFATDADKGNVDRLVKQPEAIMQLRDAGLDVKVHDYKPGALGHVIHSEDMEKMNRDLIAIFSESDKF